METINAYDTETVRKELAKPVKCMKSTFNPKKSSLIKFSKNRKCKK